jgi:hypothetical protein
MEVSEEGLTHEQRQTLKAIRQRKTEVVAVHRSKKAVANNQATLPRGADRDRKSNTTNMRVSSIAGCAVWLHSKLACKWELSGVYTACKGHQLVFCLTYRLHPGGRCRSSC